MCALCRSVCHDPELRIHSDQDSRRHSFPSGVLAVGAEGGPDLSVALGCVCKGDVTVAWPPGLCSQLSVEAELQLLPWFVLADLCSPLPGAAHKLVCYFASWAQSRPGPASVLPHDLDPFLCTHLIFAFATMENNQIVAMTSQKGKIVYPEFNKLKERNRELRTLLSIGGWDFGTSKFTTMLSTLSNRKKFIHSVILLLRTYNFDGLDLFFLYPGLRGSPMSDRRTFLLLIKELLFAFQNEVKLDMRPRLLLSAAVSGDPHIIQIAYDVHLLGKLLDFINVLSYDFHGSWEKFTGHNSPLFSLPGDPSSSICSFLQRATKRWIDFQQVPYAYKGKVWVGYDDANSFSSKAMFIKEEHFGGAMVWTLDLDDAKGTFCRTGPFPLVHKLHSLLVQAGGKSTATNTHGKSQNTTTASHRGGTVSPTSKTASFVRHTVALEGKTETVGETVTLGEMTMISMQLLTSVKKDKPFVKRVVAPEMMTIPSGKMKVTPDGQTKILRGENLTSEVNTDPLMGYVDL
ncbi:oviduct-specific glycoprotein isoform X1 [Vulpes vulpes]|uniref:Oviduct-specific glycoprotein n=1 Tax=Vulpes vulpes TaxID=9627 RepID=A0ABM5B688_VULVU